MRVSTRDQADRDTQEGQKHVIRERVERDKLHVYQPRLPKPLTDGDFYTDAGTSAERFPLWGRPAGKHLFEDGIAGKFNRIMVTDLDRLIRMIAGDADKARERGQFFGWLIEEEILIETPYGEVFDSNDVMSDIKVAMTSEDGRKRKERFERGKLSHVEQGFWAGGPTPYGYSLQPVDPFGTSRKSKLKINPVEAVSARRMFDLALQGHGQKQIATMLNEEGVSPRGNGRAKLTDEPTKWSSGSVRYILKNPVYTGMMTYRKKRDVKKNGTVKREDRPKQDHIAIPLPEECHIVTPEEFELVQNLTKKRRTVFDNGRAKSRVFLLSGLCKCQECIETGANGGKGFNLHGKYNGGRIYYQCFGRWKTYGSVCSTKAYSMEEINTKVCREVYSFLNNPEEYRKHADGFKDGLINRQALEADAKRLGNLLAKSKGEEEKLVEGYRKGLFTDEQIEKEMVKI